MDMSIEGRKSASVSEHNQTCIVATKNKKRGWKEQLWQQALRYFVARLVVDEDADKQTEGEKNKKERERRIYATHSLAV